MHNGMIFFDFHAKSSSCTLESLLGVNHIYYLLASSEGCMHKKSVADLHTKVSSTCPPPTGPNSFIFIYVFTEKHLCQSLAPPPMRVGTPQWEILDPPLKVFS